MTKLLRKLFPFLSPKEALLLDSASIEKLRELSRVSYDKLNDEDKKEVLRLGAKDFSNKFSGVIKTLANE